MCYTYVNDLLSLIFCKVGVYMKNVTISEESL